MSSLKYICIPVLLLALLSGCSTYKNRITDTKVSDGSYAENNIESRYLHIGNKHRSYEFIMNTGGILVFEPDLQSDGTYFLPLVVDVSGYREVTVEPSKQYPDLGVREVVVGHAVEDSSRLLLYVSTSSIGEDAPSSISRGLKIGKLDAGSYTIEYLDRDGGVTLLREFTIE